MKRLCRSCLFTAALPLLSGCLLINAALGVAGLLGTGPIQYASTAYSVGEYGYHFAVRGKTPDEVIEEKLAELLPADEPDGEGALLAEAAPPPPAQAGPAPVIPASPPVRAMAESAVSVLPAPAPAQPAPMPRAGVRPAARTVERTAAVPAAWTPETLPHSTPDPLLASMDRMESALALAERIALSRTGDGLRMVATTQDAGRPGPGVSGGWSIRHPVMQYGPDAGRAVAVSGGLRRPSSYEM